VLVGLGLAVGFVTLDELGRWLLALLGLGCLGADSVQVG
jgi:hypothetical protein